MDSKLTKNKKLFSWLLLFVMVFSFFSSIPVKADTPEIPLNGDPRFIGKTNITVGTRDPLFQPVTLEIPILEGTKDGDTYKIDILPKNGTGYGLLTSNNVDIKIGAEKIGEYVKATRQIVFNKNVEKYANAKFSLKGNLWTAYLYNKTLTKEAIPFVPYWLKIVVNGKQVGNGVVARYDLQGLETRKPLDWFNLISNWYADDANGYLSLRISAIQPTNTLADGFIMDVSLGDKVQFDKSMIGKRIVDIPKRESYRLDVVNPNPELDWPIISDQFDIHQETRIDGLDDNVTIDPPLTDGADFSIKIPKYTDGGLFYSCNLGVVAKVKPGVNPKDIVLGLRVYNTTTKKYWQKYGPDNDSWYPVNVTVLDSAGAATGTREGVISVEAVNKQGNALPKNFLDLVNLKILSPTEDDKVIAESKGKSLLTASELFYGEYAATISLDDPATGEKPVIYGDVRQEGGINSSNKSRIFRFVVDREESTVEYKIQENVGSIKDSAILTVPTHDAYTILENKVAMNDGYKFTGYSFNDDNNNHQPKETVTLKPGKNTLSVNYSIRVTYEKPNGEEETVYVPFGTPVNSFLPDAPKHFSWDNNASEITEPTRFGLVEDPKTDIILKNKDGVDVLRTKVYSNEDFNGVPTLPDRDDSFFDGYTITDSEGNTYDLPADETVISAEKLIPNGELNGVEKTRPAVKLMYEIPEKYGAIEGEKISGKQELNTILKAGENITLNLKDGVIFKEWANENDGKTFNNGDEVLLDLNKTLTAKVRIVVTYLDVNGNKIGEEAIEPGEGPKNIPPENELDRWPEMPTSIDEPTTIQKENYYVTITYQEPDGTVLRQEIQRKNTAPKEVDNPIKEGYEFDGWLDGKNPADFTKPIKADKTFIANFTKLHSVKHIIDSRIGSVQKNAETIVRNGDEFNVGNNVELTLNDGYVFNGWNDELGNNVDKAIITQDRVFNASYKVQITLLNDKNEKTIIEVLPGEKLPTDQIPNLPDNFNWPESVNKSFFAPTIIKAKEQPVEEEPVVEDVKVSFIVDGKIFKEFIMPKGDSLNKIDIPEVNINNKTMNGWKKLGSNTLFEFPESLVINEATVFIADLTDIPVEEEKVIVSYDFPENSASSIPQNKELIVGKDYVVEKGTLNDGYQLEHYLVDGKQVQPGEKLTNIQKDTVLTAKLKVRVQTPYGDVWLGQGGNYDESALPKPDENCMYVLEDNQLTNLIEPTTVKVACKSPDGEAVNQSPIINGPVKQTIQVGDAIDLDNLGVKAFDPEDGELKPVCLNPEVVNVSKAGQFVLKFRATDSKGAQSPIHEMIVIVKDKPVIEKPIEKPDQKPVVEKPNTVKPVPNSPSTGESQHVALYIVLVLFSLGAAALLIKFKIFNE